MGYKKGLIIYFSLNSSYYGQYDYSDTFLQSYLGGRGFNSAILHKIVEREGVVPKDVFSPENLLLISSGLFAGTEWPSAGRTTISILKSPVTQSFCDGNLGGHFGPALRLAGIDCLILDGKAEVPSYIYVDTRGSCKLIECREQWLFDTYGMDSYLKKKHGQNVKCLVIGPAGARCVFSAVAMCENRTAGGGGIGAVLGGKKIKAIVVEYDSKQNKEASRSLSYVARCDEAKTHLETHPVYKTFRKYGTTSLVTIHSALNYFPAKNWLFSKWKSWKAISGEAVYKRSKKRIPKYVEYLEELEEKEQLGCRNCPIVCSNEDKIEYETLNCLGPKIGICSLEDILTLNYIYMNGYGLDVIQTTSVISALMEMSEKGIIDYDLPWGDVKRIRAFLDNFIYNQKFSGVGGYFRKGFEKGLKSLIAASIITINYPKLVSDLDITTKKLTVLLRKTTIQRLLTDTYFVGTKGMGMSGVFPNKEHKLVALAVATSSRGADHLRSLPTLATYADWYAKTLKGVARSWKKYLKLFSMPVRAFSTMKGDASIITSPDLYDSYETLFGVPRPIVLEWKELGFLEDPSIIEGCGEMVKFTQHIYAVSDAVSICRFTSPWRFGIGPEKIGGGIHALTGYLFTWEMVMDVGRRIYTLERDLLYRYGTEVKDDLNPRFFKGAKSLSLSDFNKLKGDYYRRCEYDRLGRPFSDSVDMLSEGTWDEKDEYFLEAILYQRKRERLERKENNNEK